MKAFRIIAADQVEFTHVPFELPTKSGVIEFTIPRLNFLSERQAREVRDKLRELEKPVPLFDPVTGDVIAELDADGLEVFVDGDGNRVDRDADGRLPDRDDIKVKQLHGPEPRTPMERTRATALAMLLPLVEAKTAKVLAGLTTGELEQIVQHWTDVSGTKLSDVEATTLGESSASLTS